jgi:hypothetical protein
LRKETSLFDLIHPHQTVQPKSLLPTLAELSQARSLETVDITWQTVDMDAKFAFG